MHLLIVEDNHRIAASLNEGLHELGYSVSVATCGADALSRIKAEPIEQAITNVIDNAIRHTPDGGRIQITQQGACVRIEDSGPGIDEALLPHIFEQFRTGGQAGQTGLGLAIAQKIVELHGGSIGAENAAGGGACFVLTFALANEIGARPVS